MKRTGAPPRRRGPSLVIGAGVFLSLALTWTSVYCRAAGGDDDPVRSVVKALFRALAEGLRETAAVDSIMDEESGRSHEGDGALVRDVDRSGVGDSVDRPEDENPYETLDGFLRDRCAACHSGSSAVVDGFDVLDVDALKAAGYLSATDPESSPMWLRVQRGEMPPPRVGSLAGREKQEFRKLLRGRVAPTGDSPPIVRNGPPDLVTFAERDGRFKIMLDWARQAGALDELRAAKGPFTVLAPTDDAIGKLHPRNIEYFTSDKSRLLKLLMNHVVNSENSLGDLTTRGSLKVGRYRHSIKREEDGHVWMNDARVLEGDIVCSNGVVHVIDKMLIPLNVIPPEPPPVNDVAGMVMIPIPAGKFVMGSPDHEEGRVEDEGPRRTVEISAFYLSCLEVTKLQYTATMGTDPSATWPGRRERPIDEAMQNVTWFDAVRFCNELSRHAGYPPFYELSEQREADNGSMIYDVHVPDRSGIGYRLPTEAEWEYACRGGQTGTYCFGNDVRQLPEYAWYARNAESTKQVETKRPNGFGLHDMHGNVAEWCHDWYGEYPATDEKDPLGPARGKARVVRGGSYFRYEETLRSAARSCAAPHFVHRSYGFRVARSVKPEP